MTISKVPTSNLVDVLEWQAQRLVGGALGRLDGIKTLEQREAGHFLLVLDGRPPLEPGHVGRLLQHVVTVPPRDGAEGHFLRVVTDLLNVARHLLHDLVVTGLNRETGR